MLLRISVLINMNIQGSCSSSGSVKKRLLLKMKCEVVKAAEREPKIGSRKLAEIFCGRKQFFIVHAIRS